MTEPMRVDFPALEAFFQADGNLIFATVFGSARDGMIAPGSDLDVAALSRIPLRPGAEYLDYYLRLCAVVPTIESVGFVNLNTANTILAFEALRGRLICKNDPEATASFTSLVCREYEDVMGHLAHQRWLCTQAA